MRAFSPAQPPCSRPAVIMGGGADVVDSILLETGDDILLETGDELLLEDAN